MLIGNQRDNTMLISYDNLTKLFTRADGNLLKSIEIQHLDLIEKYELTTPNRINYLFAQIAHESAGYTTFNENLNYSAKRLMQVWSSRFKTIRLANAYAMNPEKLANYVYANRMGNGPESSGDGWMYRGRGPIQLTGKDAYAAISSIIGYDFVTNPNDLVDPKFMFESACAVWKWKKLNPICDSGHFTLVTERINGGQTGLTDRKNWLKRVETTLSISKAIQLKLNQFGLYRGAIDGAFGPVSQRALGDFKVKYNANDANVISMLFRS